MEKNELLVLGEAVNTLSTVEVTKELIESGDFTPAYEQLKAAIDELTELKKSLDGKIRDTIAPLYENDGTTTLSDNVCNYTLVAATTSLSVDTAKLKREFPDIYKACVKTSQRAASLRVTKKSGEDNA